MGKPGPAPRSKCGCLAHGSREGAHSGPGHEGRDFPTTHVGPTHPKGARQREGLRPELQDPVLGDSQEMPNLLEPLD